MHTDDEINEIFNDGWDGFFDVINGVYSIFPDRETAVKLFSKLPDWLQDKAFTFGLDHEFFCDESKTYFEKEGYYGYRTSTH